MAENNFDGVEWTAKSAKSAKTLADKTTKLKPTLLTAIRTNTKCPYVERGKRKCIHCVSIGQKAGKVYSQGEKYSLCGKCASAAKRLMAENNFDGVAW